MLVSTKNFIAGHRVSGYARVREREALSDLRERVETMLRDAEGAEAFFGPQDDLARPVAEAPLTEAPGTVIGRYEIQRYSADGRIMCAVERGKVSF